MALATGMSPVKKGKAQMTGGDQYERVSVCKNGQLLFYKSTVLVYINEPFRMSNLNLRIYSFSSHF